MRKFLLFIALLAFVGITPGCSKRAYSQQEGLLLTNKYNHPRNKKKSKQAQKNYKQRQKALKKKR